MALLNHHGINMFESLFLVISITGKSISLLQMVQKCMTPYHLNSWSYLLHVNLMQVVNRLTKRDKRLDIIILTNANQLIKFNVHPSVCGSNHDLVLGDLAIKCQSSVFFSRKFGCNNNASYTAILNVLSAYEWNAVFKGYRLVNQYWTKLYSLLACLIPTYVPILKNIPNKKDCLSA